MLCGPPSEQAASAPQLHVPSANATPSPQHRSPPSATTGGAGNAQHRAPPQRPGQRKVWHTRRPPAPPPHPLASQLMSIKRASSSGMLHNPNTTSLPPGHGLIYSQSQTNPSLSAHRLQMDEYSVRRMLHAHEAQLSAAHKVELAEKTKELTAEVAELRSQVESSASRYDEEREELMRRHTASLDEQRRRLSALPAAQREDYERALRASRHEYSLRIEQLELGYAEKLKGVDARSEGRHLELHAEVADLREQLARAMAASLGYYE